MLICTVQTDHFGRELDDPFNNLSPRPSIPWLGELCSDLEDDEYDAVVELQRELSVSSTRAFGHANVPPAQFPDGEILLLQVNSWEPVEDMCWPLCMQR